MLEFQWEGILVIITGASVMKEKRRDAVRANNVPKYGNQFKWKGSLNKRYLI